MKKLFPFNPLDHGFAWRKVANDLWSSPAPQNPKTMPNIWQWRFWAVPFIMIGEILRDNRKKRAK